MEYSLLRLRFQQQRFLNELFVKINLKIPFHAKESRLMQKN